MQWNKRHSGDYSIKARLNCFSIFKNFLFEHIESSSQHFQVAPGNLEADFDSQMSFAPQIACAARTGRKSCLTALMHLDLSLQLLLMP